MQCHFINIKNNNSFLLFVKVIPNFKANSIIGILEHINKTYLKIGIKSIPEKNKANIELINFLSSYFNIPKKEIIIKSGNTSTLKTLNINTVYLDNIKNKLKAIN